MHYFSYLACRKKLECSIMKTDKKKSPENNMYNFTKIIFIAFKPDFNHLKISDILLTDFRK